MEIKVYSQYDFEQMCKTKHLNDSNVESTLDAYVCVHNSKDMSPFFKEEHSNVLNLFFLMIGLLKKLRRCQMMILKEI